jgi:hypothetical protein
LASEDGAAISGKRLLAALASCLLTFSAHAAALGLDGSRWSVLYSRDCPASPSTVTVNGKTAWRLEIKDNCQPHYVLRPANDKLRALLTGPVSSLVVTMQIADANLKSVQDGGTDAYATVMLQRRGDDLSGEDEYAHYRQWAFKNRIKLVDGTFTVTIPMDRMIWTGVRGKNAPDSAWKDLLANLDKIGITLGGTSDGGHGVEGNAELYLLEFKAN